MHWLRSKRFWLTVAHIGLISGAVASSVIIPGSGIAIMAGAAAVNGMLPSPLSK